MSCLQEKVNENSLHPHDVLVDVVLKNGVQTICSLDRLFVPQFIVSLQNTYEEQDHQRTRRRVSEYISMAPVSRPTLIVLLSGLLTS